MGSIGYANNHLVGLRVVRGPNWEWDTQDDGEGFVGTVVDVVNTQNPRRVKVRWDSGQEFIYRIGAEDAYDLRVLDNSIVGVKHPGVECRGCGQKDIAGMRWQCFDCLTPIDLCTFCFTNEKHEQKHVNFRRYHHPSFDPSVVFLDSEKQKVQLKGIYPGALVMRGTHWQYVDEDQGTYFGGGVNGKVVTVPTDCKMTPGKVWVQWSHEEDKSYSYRVGLSGKMDLKIAKAGIGGHYQPDTLPDLVISKPSADEKPNDVVADLPFVIGDMVKLVVGLEELREMMVDCELNWSAGEMEKVLNENLMIKEIYDRGEIARVELANKNSELYVPYGFLLPVKAMRRLIPWLPVGAVVQLINKSHSNVTDMDALTGDFGRVKQVNLDGKTVDMEFFTSGGNVSRTISVSQLQDKFVDVSVIEKVESVRTDLAKHVESVGNILAKLRLSEVILKKVGAKLESIRKDLAKLLVSEVEKGSNLSVQFLLKTYPDIINCQSSYDERNSTALSVACQKGNVEMVKLLLKHNASVDIADQGDEEEDYDESDEDEPLTNTPVYHAVLGNHPEVLRLLLRNGASPNVEWYLRPPLHLAAMKGHVECVRVLLEDERCDVDLKDYDGNRAFRLAVKSSVQSVELFNLLHANGKLNIIEENDVSGRRNLLHLAAEYNNLGAAKFLLSCPEGKNLAGECDQFKTPLFIACDYGHNQIAKLLVSNVDKDENGKPRGINTPNKEGKTPLMRVIEKFNYELIELLIGAGANLHATDDDGDTPFHYAARLYREKASSFIDKSGFKRIFRSWPNQETAPAIFKIYNELQTKHPDENLSPFAAIIYYLVINGGISHNLTLPKIKNLLSDDFLYGESSKFVLFLIRLLKTNAVKTLISNTLS